jgi:hypothetical protein
MEEAVVAWLGYYYIYLDGLWAQTRRGDIHFQVFIKM